MTRQPVTSSNIASIGHDPDSQRLHVEFHSGKVYEYRDVSADEHQALVNAPSIGAHFSKHIRPKGGTPV